MAVVWAREHWEGRDGSFGSVTDNTMTRVWKVKTNNKLDDQTVIVAHFTGTMGIAFLSPHPSNGFFTARKIDPKQMAVSPYAWTVTVTYSTEPLREDEDEPENPLDRPVRISWSSELSQEFTTKDKDGKPMLNSAGDPLEPYEKDDVRWIIRLVKNFSALPTWVANFTNKVNSSSLSIGGLTLAERTCKVQSLQISEQQVQNDIPYVEVSVEIAYRPDTWDAKRLDEGFHEKLGSTRQKILLDDNNEPSEPVPLNGAGAHISEPDPDNAVYLDYEIYEEEDLNDLPFS
jgi:hypothetical protein